MESFLTQFAVSPLLALRPLTYLVDDNFSNTNSQNIYNFSNATIENNYTFVGSSPSKNYFALLLLIIPSLTILGNGLVVTSICREKALQTTTNYLILSLAVADFLVAFCVMPFAVYVEVEELNEWRLPKLFCNLYIAADVWASTASILNLVAVSWDRYMAVSSPIQYAQNSRKRVRVKTTIFFVWFVSLVTALPVVMGLNDLRNTNHCEFTNALYICVSSLISFYMPCVIIIVLYTIVLKKLKRRRASAIRYKNKRPIPMETNQDDLADDVTICDGRLLNHNDSLHSLSGDDFANGKVVKESTCVEETITILGCTTTVVTQQQSSDDVQVVQRLLHEHAAVILPTLLPNHTEEGRSTDVIKKSLSDQNFMRGQIIINDKRNNTYSTWHNTTGSGSMCVIRNGFQTTKIYPRRRESKRSRKERKATQTLAVVLGVFLICWLPFFTCHLTNSICKFRFKEDCVPMMAMLVTTWLGYVNSFLNPIIYTVFNPMYRKAFKKLFRSPSKRYK